MRKGFPSSTILVLCSILSGLPALAQNGRAQVEVIHAVKHDVSPPLRDIEPPLRQPGPPREIPWRRTRPPTVTPTQLDPVVQTSAGASVAITAGNSFDGVGEGFVLASERDRSFELALNVQVFLAAGESTVFIGDSLRTGADGAARLTVSGRGSLVVSSQTRISFVADPRYFATLQQGSAGLRSLTDAKNFQLRVGSFSVVPDPGAEAAAEVELAADGSARVTCTAGSVGVIDLEGAQSAFLHPGETATISPEGASQAGAPAAGAPVPGAPAPTAPAPPAPTPVAKKKSRAGLYVLLGLAGAGAAGAAAGLAGHGGAPSVSPSTK